MANLEPLPLNTLLPDGKRAAICLSIDDIHPGTSSDPYEAGGDRENGALGHLLELQRRHPELKATLFTTADWRQKSPFPTNLWRHIPYLRDHVYTTSVHPPGTMALDNHPKFSSWLAGLPNVEIGFHGLHHVHKGMQVGREFQDESVFVHLDKLDRMRDIFQRARLPYVKGMAPPCWHAAPSLLEALKRSEMEFLASSRDIFSAVEENAVCRMSGLEGTPLCHPCWIEGMVHVPTNFQATCPPERAEAIVEAGGVLSIKAHIIKTAYGHVSLDAMDAVYGNYLDLLFRRLKATYGESLWFVGMNELQQRVRQVYSAPLS